MGIRAFAQRTANGLLEEVALEDHPTLAPTEVELEVSHCGVCHSDLHLLDGDWGAVARPLVPRHEIVGRIVRVGGGVPRNSVQVGALIGVGSQAGACFQCEACQSGRSHLCTHGKVRTWFGHVGGFAERVVVDHRFCFALPSGLDPRDAAPLLCAGLTVYSPMKRLGIPRDANVAVVGLGGLGHLAVQFAAKMGARVTVFDVDSSRSDLAASLGAASFACMDLATSLESRRS